MLRSQAWYFEANTVAICTVSTPIVTLGIFIYRLSQYSLCYFEGFPKFYEREDSKFVTLWSILDPGSSFNIFIWSLGVFHFQSE